MVVEPVSSLRIEEVKNLICVIVLYTITNHKSQIDITMRIEDFLGYLNISIAEYTDLLQIFIAALLVLLAYQFFFYPTLVVLLIGIPSYIWIRTYGQAQVDKLRRDLAQIAGTKNTATVTTEPVANTVVPSTN